MESDCISAYNLILNAFKDIITVKPIAWVVRRCGHSYFVFVQFVDFCIFRLEMRTDLPIYDREGALPMPKEQQEVAEFEKTNFEKLSFSKLFSRKSLFFF